MPLIGGGGMTTIFAFLMPAAAIRLRSHIQNAWDLVFRLHPLFPWLQHTEDGPGIGSGAGIEDIETRQCGIMTHRWC